MKGRQAEARLGVGDCHHELCTGLGDPGSLGLAPNHEARDILRLEETPVISYCRNRSESPYSRLKDTRLAC